MDELQIVEKFEEFFRQFYEEELMKVVRKGKKALEVDFLKLDKF